MILFALILVGGNRAATSVEVPDDWVTVKAKDIFSFRAPPDLVEQPVQGKDSFVGKYDSASLELTFDYGRYSDPLEREDYQNWTFRTTTVDGQRARIGKLEDRMAIHFPRVLSDKKQREAFDVREAEAAKREGNRRNHLSQYRFPLNCG